jgi:1-acyl-sn-glycerol-3-phosphate acyltransferase
MLYVIGRFLCAIFCLFFFRLRVTGQECVPKKGAFIIAGNHASFLDPVIFGVACPRQLNYLARDTLFRNRFFGRILKSVHVIPLKRNAADIGAFKEGLRRLKDGQGLLLFPEGTRSINGKLGKGHHGVGFLARKSGVPVVPVYARGTYRALPKGAKFFRPLRIAVVFGPAMTLEYKQGLSDQEVSDKIMEEIKKLSYPLQS